VWRSKNLQSYWQSNTNHRSFIQQPSSLLSWPTSTENCPTRLCHIHSFNNVEVSWKRNLYFRHNVYGMFSQRLTHLVWANVLHPNSPLHLVTHGYISYVCLVQTRTAFFAWISTSIHFAIAVLISPSTAFPLDVVFQFHYFLLC